MSESMQRRFTRNKYVIHEDQFLKFGAVKAEDLRGKIHLNVEQA